MASFNKFNVFTDNLGLKTMNLSTDTINVYLSNAAPSASNTVYGTPADLSTGGGYTAGGASVTPVWSATGGTATLSGTTVVFTATSGFGGFRYVVLYDVTASGSPLIGWWDYGSSVTLGASETFTVAFGASILTIT